MAADRLEAEITALVAELAHTKPELVDLDRRMDEQGIDSLQLIVLRERLQMAIGAVFSDEEWMSVETPADILAGVHGRSAKAALSERSLSTPQSSGATATFTAAGLSVRDLEIGMPLTGRNNLAETPLLQYLGDLRWRDISEMIGVPTREIVDDQGERLYATFFYVEVAFPPERPMATFGENDRFRIISTLARYGTSMLDGVSFLVPANGNADRVAELREAPFSSLQEAVAAGVPAVRLSNIFVKKFAGAEWLKKGRPVHPRFTEIPALPEPPDSYLTTKEVEKAGRFGSCGLQSIPMTDGPVQRDYRLVPDRDLNGAGLVYFANYPMFLDICERDVLLSARLPLSEGLVDRRTVIHRQSAYLNNASSGDILRIEIEPWISVPEVPRRESDETTDLHLHINCRMYRRSDERLMMVSTVQKVVGAVSIADTQLAFAENSRL
jgi:probable biosynthetic protein (TIGR04098 family)